jgi:pimeloyl-ACP methyl ester carboxylesterase
MIDQLEAINVNGTKQWLLCRGHDSRKPVVLFVHGGPGSPLMMFSRAFDDAFLNDFVVVHWDQRQSGKSFSATTDPKSLTLEQFVSDGLVVVDHLKKKFAFSSVLLVGHSWGTIVASHMVLARPADFLGYISVGTIGNMSASDVLKHDFLTSQIASEDDTDAIADFERIGLPPYNTFDQILIRSRLLWRYGGIFHSLTSEQINQAVMKSTEYSPEEFQNQGLGMELLCNQLTPLLNSYDAKSAIRLLVVPVIFVQGQFDMATPVAAAKDFFENLEAPAGKKMILFEKSAHFPMYEEPLRFLGVLRSAVN